MKKNILTIIFILIAGLSAFSRDWKVKVKLFNDTKDTITAYVKAANQTDSDPKFLFRKTLKIGVQWDTIVVVKQYSLISAYAVLLKGGRTEGKDMLVNENNLTFSPELTLPKDLKDDNKPSLTDFTTSPKILEFDPKKFLNNDIYPQPIGELFNQYLGGLAICINTNGKDSMIDHISPYDLGAEITPYYNSVEDKKEFYFNKQTDQKIKAGIPGIVQLGVTFEIGKMYHLKIVYKGVGIVGWKSDKNPDIEKNFVENLGIYRHYKIARAKIRYGDNLRVYQINKAYCFEGIYYQNKEMSKANENHTLNASVYFFNEGNYINENTSIIERTFGGEYLGYWSDNPKSFNDLLDYSLSAYYTQQRNIFATLSDDEVVREYKKMVKGDSLSKGLTKATILAYLDSYINAYKLSKPAFAQNSALKTNPVVVNEDLDPITTAEIDKHLNHAFIKKSETDVKPLTISEIDSNYKILNKQTDNMLPKDATIELKKQYLKLMKMK